MKRFMGKFSDCSIQVIILSPVTGLITGMELLGGGVVLGPGMLLSMIKKKN